MVALTFISKGITRVFTDKTDAARLMGVTSRTIHNWVGKGVITRSSHGDFVVHDDVTIKTSGRGMGSPRYPKQQQK